MNERKKRPATPLPTDACNMGRTPRWRSVRLYRQLNLVMPRSKSKSSSNGVLKARNARAGIEHRPLLRLADAGDIRAAVATLRKACPTMRRLHDLVGDPPIRK